MKYTKVENLKHGDVVMQTWNDPRCNALGTKIYLKKDGKPYLCSLIEFATCIKPAYDGCSNITSDMVFYHALDYYGNPRNIFKKH